MEYAKMQVLKNYPFMQGFLNRCRTEDVSEALVAIEKQRGVLEEVYTTLKNQSDRELFISDVSFEKLDAMLDYTISGLMTARFEEASFHPEMLYEETVSYLDMMKKISYKK
jgi:hypothetical protein